MGFSLPLLALFAGYGLKRLPADSGLAAPGAWIPVLALAAGGGVVCALLAWSRRERAAIAGVAILMAALAAATAAEALPRLDPYLSAREAARITQEEARSTDFVSILGSDRSLQFGLEYYLDRPVPDWTPAAPKPAWIWTVPRGWADLQRLGLHGTLIRKLSQETWLVRIDPPPNP